MFAFRKVTKMIFCSSCIGRTSFGKSITAFCIFVINIEIMITINIDERSKAAKAFVEFIKQLPFVKIENEVPRYNIETEKVMSDSRKGVGVKKAKNSNDLFIKLGI